METTGRDAQLVALAVKVNGDVTSAPSIGAATEMPEDNFAVTDGGGIEHPVIAIPDARAAKPKNSRGSKYRKPLCFAKIDRAQFPGFELAGYSGIRTLSCFLGQDAIRAPNDELDRVRKKAISAGTYRDPREREN